LCFVKSLNTEAINHDPAITFFQTGAQMAGRPSFGSWLSYGLGSANENLPAFVVLISKDRIDQPLYSRLWGSGFLPSLHQGVPGRRRRETARPGAALLAPVGQRFSPEPAPGRAVSRRRRPGVVPPESRRH